MKNIAVILSGSGVYDGSEIHEAVLTLLAIENNQAAAATSATLGKAKLHGLLIEKRQLR